MNVFNSSVGVEDWSTRLVVRISENLSTIACSPSDDKGIVDWRIKVVRDIGNIDHELEAV